MMKNNLKELKQRALSGDLAALDELRRLGLLSASKAKYKMAPVSYSQRRLWFIDKMEKSPAYNLPAAIILEGKLDISALENAFYSLIRRHEILRTVFVETDGVPFQKILNETSFKLAVSDVSQEENKEQKVKALIDKELNRCFDLSEGPLMTCSLVRTDANKYWMIFNMHHIISDGWSVGVLISELTQFYNSSVKNINAPLENLKVQYSDYVRRQNKLLEDPGSDVHRTYWLEKFSGELPVSDLPSDKPRPVYKTFSGKMHEITIDENLHRKIESFCRQKNASLFMFMLAVVNVLINKYTGKSDIITGTPVSGREQRDLEEQIGFYVNTIPLRNKIESSRNFAAFLEDVKKNCIEAYDHQIYPFDLLIEDLKLERNTGRNPLFETVVSLQEANADKLEFEGLKTTIVENEIPFSKFDLHFNIEESSSVLKISIIYNTDLYTDARIKRAGLHLMEILNNVLLSPDTAITDIEFITAEERERILKVFNNTSASYPKDRTIAELFEETASKYPEKAAVVYKGTPVSYRQLNEWSNFLAEKLRNSCGVKIEEPVAILMERSHYLVASILGVLKAGGAYLPLDTKMPDERLKFILGDVKADLLLADKMTDNINYHSGQVICIDEKFFEDSEGRPDYCSGKTSSNLAYILYTSGSTGTPKGSMIEDRSVIRLVKNTNYINLTDKDRLLSVSSMSFDAVTMDLWGSLLNGGTLYLEDTEDYLDPEKLGRFISEYKLNLMLVPTGLFVRLTEADYQNDLKLFSGIKTLIVGGDRLPYISANRLLELYPGIQLINGYGPTENTTFTTFYNVNSVHLNDIPIGKPVSNTTVYIFNESGNLCPEGVPGELYIGGDGLSRGYVNRPDLNRERFVPNPLNKNEILYRSGDICEWCEDGNIRFIGRNDDQLKIRGFRVETGEIENTAAKFKGIKNTKVLVIQEDEQKELALYYTSDGKIKEDEIRTYLSDILADYMIPKYFVQMDEFPLNNNGKVDTKAFPKPGISKNNRSIKSGPLTITERKLAGIFENILSVGNIPLSSSFFSLGGHSLKAIKAVSAIQKELSVNVSLKEFFAHPDILSLSEIIRGRKREAVGTIPAVTEAEYYELSHAQKRLWVLDKIEKLKSAYNVPLALLINDTLDINALQSAFDSLIFRNESLRTVFIEKEGAPFQKILGSVKNPVKVLDFSSSDDPDQSALAYITGEAQRAFDLQEFPLIRLYLIKIAPEKQLLFINIHHIICDGWSVNVMVSELFTAYSRYINNSDEAAAPAPDIIQYKDYAAWQNRMINSGENNTDRTYWLEKLGGDISVMDVPADFPRPAVKTYIGKSYYYSFPSDLKNGLDKFILEKRSSLFITLNAAIKVLLHKYTGAEDIIIGSPLAGRNHPDLENQIGCFVNTLALRDSIKPDMTFVEFLEGVKKTSVDAYTYQMYPFDKLLDEIKISRDTSHSPLFDIVIVLNNFEFSYKDIFEKAEPYSIPM
ncbi:MAG: amino acid adenylation domain-containing protein, partial [Syntrophothermus sp.]